MNTNELLTYLQKKYPKHEFGLDTPESLGLNNIYSEDEVMPAVPEKMIYFVWEGIAMWDVYASNCSRFTASPKEYNITEEDGKKILEHNKASIHDVYDEVFPPTKKAVKSSKISK